MLLNPVYDFLVYLSQLEAQILFSKAATSLKDSGNF